MELELHVLVIEDNPGDFWLITDFFESIAPKSTLTQAMNFKEAQAILLQPPQAFDLILLDLSLPDAGGKKLVLQVVQLANGIPVVVLTGFSDQKFGIDTLNLGVYDYLLKDELTESILLKSITYSLERAKISSQIRVSERKYRALFDTSPIPMFLLDKSSLTIVDANSAALAQYGYSSEELLGAPFWVLDKQQKPDPYRSWMDDRESEMPFFEHQKKNGELLLVELSFSESDQFGSGSLLFAANDVTQRVAAERELIFREQRLKALTQKGSDVFAIVDSEGKFFYIGENAVLVFGLDAHDMLGKTLFDFVHPDERTALFQEFSSVLLDEVSRRLSPYRVVNANQETGWIETHATNSFRDASIRGIILNSRNITKQIESDFKLRDVRSRFEVISDVTTDIVWDIDLIQETVTWSKGITSVLKYAESYLQTDVAFILDSIHPDDRERVQNGLFQFFESGDVHWHDEYRFRAADGTYVPFRDKGYLVFDEQHAPIRFIGSMTDISKEKQEEYRIKLFETVIDYSSDAVALAEIQPQSIWDSKFVFANDSFKRLLQLSYSKEYPLRKILELPVIDEQIDFIFSHIRSLNSFRLDLTFKKTTKEDVFYNLSFALLENDEKQVKHAVIMLRDITQRVNKEQEITAAIIQAQEVERFQIGCELHDNINQILSAVQLALNMVLEEEHEAEKNKWILHAKNFNQNAITEIRSLSHRLAPNSLDETKFTDAVLSLVKSMNLNEKFQTVVSISDQWIQTLPANYQLHLYRIIQEVLNNISKHAQASKIEIVTAADQHYLTLSISDDGIGFDKSKITRGIGLNNIQKRCELIRANFQILSNPGAGSKVLVQIPWSK